MFPIGVQTLNKKNIDIITLEGDFNHVTIKLLIGQIKSFLQECAICFV